MSVYMCECVRECVHVHVCVCVCVCMCMCVQRMECACLCTACVCMCVQARAHCADKAKFKTAACHGFVYVRVGSWSCGAVPWPVSVRNGQCDTPGAAYFFNRRRIQQRDDLRDPPHGCSAFTVAPDPLSSLEKCGADVPTRMDTWWRYVYADVLGTCVLMC